MNKCVFWDRDGVINEAIIKEGVPTSPLHLKEFVFKPFIREVLKASKRFRYLNIIVTNQPNIARGLTTHKVIQSFHSKISKDLKIDDIFTCFHDDKDGCSCRKPKTGLLEAAAKKYDIDFKASLMVGDRWRDIEAGQRLQCQTIWVDNGYSEPTPSSFDYKVQSLHDIHAILQRKSFATI